MTQSAESVWKSVLDLSADERAEIAARIFESLGTAVAHSDEQVDSDQFLEERLLAADRGDFAPGTAFDVIEDVRLEMHRRRGER